MLYEDPTKDLSSDERFHVELHFSPGVNCCVQKELPPGPGFRPHSRNNEQHSSSASEETVLDDEYDEFIQTVPPLVCTFKSSRQKLIETLDNNEKKESTEPSTTVESILDEVAQVGLDDVQEVSEPEEVTNDDLINVAKNGETASEPIEINSPRNSRDHQVNHP
jgi:hypothetical protein